MLLPLGLVSGMGCMLDTVERLSLLFCPANEVMTRRKSFIFCSWRNVLMAGGGVTLNQSEWKWWRGKCCSFCWIWVGHPTCAPTDYTVVVLNLFIHNVRLVCKCWRKGGNLELSERQKNQKNSLWVMNGSLILIIMGINISVNGADQGLRH